ncbi:MAG: hypothetical protein ACE5GL_03590, partial [Calditrichia bacterium]
MIKKRYLIALFAFFAFAANAHAISPLNIELEVNETSLGEIKGSFVLENRSNEAFTDLKYILSLKEPPKVETYTSAEGVETKETTYNNYLIKAERSAESITIGSGAEESRDFVFSYPKNLPPGDYEFSIDVVDGQVGDTLTFDVIESTQLQGLQNFLTIKENSCFVIKDEVEFFQEEGPNFDSGATPEAKCRVYNPSSNTIQFEGEVTYGEFGVFNYPNAGTKTVKSGNYTLGPKEEKEIIIKLPSLTKSQAYQAFVNFVDDKGDEISPSPSFRWIVKGEGARIVEIKTDKDFYETGDEANIDIDFVGSPDMWWQIFGDEEGSTLEGFDINVKMTDQEGTLCAEKSEPFSGRVEDGDLQTASVKLKIEKDCKNPKIAANFVKNGGVLSSQEKSFVSGDSTPQKELPWETVIVLTTVLLALIIASIIYKKKPTKISLLLLLFVLGILLYVFLAIEIQPNTSEAALTGKQVKRRCEEGRSSRDSFCFGFKQSKKKNNVALVKPEIQNVAVTTLGADGKVSEGSASNIIEGGNDDITKVSFYVNQEDKYLNFEIKMKYSYDFASGTGYLCSNSTPRQVQTEFGLRDFGVEIDKFTDIQRLGGSTWSDTKTINLRYSISEIEQAWPIIDPETGEVSIDPVTGEPRYYFGSSHPYGDLRLVTKTAGALQVKGKVYPGDFNLPPKVDNVAGQVPLYPPFTKQAGETISEVYQRLFDVYFDKRKKLIGSGEQPWTRIKLVHIGRRSTVKAGSNPPSRTINLGEKITLTALNGYDPDYKDYVNEYTWQYKSPSEDCDKFEKPRVWKKDSSLMFRFTKNTLGTNSCQGEKLENPPGSTKSNIGFVDNTDGDSSLLPATTAYFSPTQAGDYWFRVRSHSSISSPGYIDFGGRNNPNDNYVRVVVDEVLEPPMPDLIIESPAFDPPSPIVNTSIDFSGTVKN